jgi:signal transduction histidine kinase
MVDSPTSSNTDFAAAFVANERQERLHTGKIACMLVIVLMPAGIALDYFVYPKNLGGFLVLRLMCSLLAAGLWFLHTTQFGYRHYRLLGIPIAWLPTFFMAWMIYSTEGPNSPYYAGLNLVILAVSAVVRWNTKESLIAVGGVLLMYLAACLLKGSREQIPIIFNNGYFLILTGVIVVVGNHFFYRLRLSEFTLRYELDKNRAALEESNRKLVELDQIKSRFFANISHELRTPLTLLLAPLESLLQRFHRAFDDDTRNLLATMHANGMRLLKLINDLLDLVRLESGRMEIKPEPLAVDEFARGLASAARQVADDKRIKLETDVAPGLGTVMADRDKLEKILLNLLFNALKFTPAGGRVSLRAEQQGEELVLIVSDTGMGIAQKNLPFIFDRFWQADGSSKRKYQGVGIGLALVKELVEIQHGKVTVESQEGSGTTFTVRLPYQKGELKAKAALPEPGSPAGLTPATGATVTSEEWLANLYRRAELFPALTPLQQAVKPVEFTGNGRRATLLVADDEPDMLRFLKSQLAPIYEVIEAVDGQQAVEKASQFLPDIILLDMMMPEKDGLQACREIRGNVPTQNIPVILLTARADEETKLAALEVGASDFLAKPFSTTELHVRIKNLVESHGYQRSLSKQNVALESTIEQLKDTESQLVQTEKLASLGRMSAGIIHEINNPLNFATTGLYALRAKGKLLPPDQRGEYEEILADVETGIQRVQRIVSDLRTFTHPDVEQCDQVDVAEVVGASLRFLSGEWRDKVRIEEKLAAGQTIWANRNKLVHVLVNLLQNSLDALEHKAFAGEVATIWVEGRLEADRSIIVIRDNGAGIDTEHLGKIFDPFFTTKDVGKGMGLGLSICYRIVREYDGRISVKTERGRFCEFTLDFPGPPPPTTSKETKHGELVRL